MIKLENGECIKKIYTKNVVPVCFAANDKYSSQTGVMIRSIIKNSSDKYNYDLIILSTDISPCNEANLLFLTSNKENISLRIFDISNIVDKITFFTESVYTKTTYSKEAYFRLFIPHLMNSYEKIIYLDGDMVALKDVSPLMSIPLKNNILAATRDYCGIAACYDPTSTRKDYRLSLGLTNIDDYFISSLIIFNVPKYNNLYSITYIQHIIPQQKWKQHDQDILNILAKGKCLLIDGKWSYFEELSYTKKFLPNKLMDELLKAAENPSIIHYAAEKKAWRDSDTTLTRFFWENAFETNFFDVFYGLLNANDTYYRYHIMKEYLHQNVGYFYTYNDIYIYSNHYLIGKMSNLKICIEFIEIKKDYIYIDGYYESLDMLGQLKLQITNNKQVADIYIYLIFTDNMQ